MRQDHPTLGILLMVGFCALAPLTDALAKILGAHVAVGELVAWRFLVQAILLIPIVLWAGETLWPEARHPRLLLWRGLLHVSGVFLFFLALRFLPLAEAIAIAYVMPFVAILLGWRFLGETVGARRILAATVGFVGTLMVVQPTFAAVGWPALLPLAVAVIFALFMLVTRAISHEIGPVRLQAISGLVSLAICVPLLLAGHLFGVRDLTLTGPPADLLAVYLLMGILGTLAHLLMVMSLKYAPAATVAPMQYLEIPFATLIGLAFFGAFPNWLALMGIAVTMAAGLYVILRERSLSRARLSAPPPVQKAEG